LVPSLYCRKRSPSLLNRDSQCSDNPHKRGEQTDANQYEGNISGRLTNGAARNLRHKLTTRWRHAVNKAPLSWKINGRRDQIIALITWLIILPLYQIIVARPGFRDPGFIVKYI
jgi:hypothetical protein